MNILIIGGGGREHALAWAVSQNPKCDRVFALPGNPGIAEIGTCVPGDPTDVDAVTEAALAHRIDLAIVGPEAPLVAGIADALRAAGV
ncbi:MAG: phosphoribosylamine--glycine ligase N-terminal domain-containing protein, partial [Pseudomonadota bacterium]